MFLSAGLSFYVLLYCFPLLLLFVTALGYTLQESDAALRAVQAFLERLFPTSERAIDQALESFVAQRNVLGLVTLGGFFVFGTFLFGAVRHVLNSVFGVEQRRSFLRGFGADIVAMLGTGSLLALTVGIGSALAVAFDIIARIPALEPYLQPGWPFLGRLLSFAFAFTLLFLLFRFAPATSLSMKSLLTASLLGASLFEISKSVFAFYVASARGYTVVYGALGGLVFFILWIYYASSVFVLAATFARVMEVDARS